jgi:PilZ domain-containing protein
MSSGRVTAASAKTDLRAFAREAVRRPAKVLAGMNGALDVTIVDFSVAGAKIKLPGNAAPARRFVLLDVGAGVAYAAELVWHKGSDAGLKFSKSANLRGLVPAEFSAARQFWLSRNERTALID